MPTLGQRRVITDFNPSGDSTVDSLKFQTANLIDNVNAIPNTNDQTARWKAEAMTLYETAAMFAVKAATAGQELPF